MRSKFVSLPRNLPSGHPLKEADKSVRAVIRGTNHSMEAIVISYGDTAIVIFAGTKGDDVDDIMTDVGIFADSSPAALISAIGNSFNHILTETQYEAANHLIEELAPHYDRILVTGHSLGGHLAVDVTLNHEKVAECIAFDPPGRGDVLIKKALSGGQESKITNYCAKGSVVSQVGIQIGTSHTIYVKENYAGPFHNHGIYEIASALGGMNEVFRPD